MPTRVNRNVLHFEAISYVIFSHKYNLIISNNKCNSHSKENPDYQSIQNEGYSCLLFVNGSLTAEAAFSVVLFFTTVFALLSLFKSLEEVERVQLHMSEMVKEYECFGAGFGMADSMLQDRIMLSLDKEKELCYTNRTRPIPFLGSSFLKLHFYQQMKVSDYKGKSMLPKATAQKRYVYLAEHGTVYHVDRQCVYLKPDIEIVSSTAVEMQRNRSGERYKRCEKCYREEKQFQTDVYITPYGNRIHTRKDCSGLKRNVRRVLQSKIGDMAECSKCLVR